MAVVFSVFCACVCYMLLYSQRSKQGPLLFLLKRTSACGRRDGKKEREEERRGGLEGQYRKLEKK